MADLVLYIEIVHDLIDLDSKIFVDLLKTATRGHHLKIRASKKIYKKNLKIPLT